VKYVFFFVLALAGCALRPLALGGATDDPSQPLPQDLRDTGLYSDWDTLTVDPSNLAYTPAFTLWSDGAEKSRWIHLPTGTTIDVSNLDEWQFPIGTKVWKEFRVDLTQPDGTVKKNQRVETRMLRKKADGTWDMVSYVWSADQLSAMMASETAPPPVPFPGTTYYEVPVLRCKQCHDQRQDKVLGFEAALLAAPEADQSGMTWEKLKTQGLVTSTASMPDASSLQFMKNGTTVERQAVGYLHTNCGIICHHTGADETTPFHMRLEWATSGPLPQQIADTEVFQTAINVKSNFVPAGGSGTYYRIRPGDTSRSTIHYRMSVRNGVMGGGEQMPPIASHVVDATGLATIDQWITSMTMAPYPTPGPTN